MNGAELNNLWGEEFELPKNNTKEVLKKIKKTKEVKDQPVEKKLKSKKISLEERLETIKKEVLRVLGKQVNNTLVIKTKQELVDYITKAIENGRIDIDTETNNSTDPITCILMGPCIYTPGLKQAYIPLNHTDLQRNRLSWQLTEADIKEQFQRLIDSKTHIIMHNGKFDYQVIKCTCKIELPVYWDTLLGCKVLNENEPAGLKWQYINKIDPEQEKYDIEHLFDAKNVEFCFIEPEIFALYAATDAMMTDKLYLYQAERLSRPDLARVYNNVFKKIEMGALIPVAEMELTGAEIDQEYAAKLKAKYTKKLKALDVKINAELEKLSGIINEWRLTPEANFRERKKALDYGDTEKFKKSKAEQLDDPIALTSPTQLAILFYDILKFAPVDPKKPRGTGEEELIKLAKKNDFPLGNLMVERRGLVKLITSFLDTIPEAAKMWPDGRVRTHYNQYGADTGRFSSSNPINFQQLPSHSKDIRMLFKATNKEKVNEFENENEVVLSLHDEILIEGVWIKVSNLKVGDLVLVNGEGLIPVKNIEILDNAKCLVSF